ncbi:MAG: hypothetical protein ABI992_07180 [Chthoniobacterales bacterium]
MEIALDHLSPALAIWHHYDPKVKADLFGTALRTSAGLFFIDPTPLPPADLATLLGGQTLTGIVVTNANHARGAVSLAQKFSSPIFARPEAKPELALGEIVELGDGREIAPGLVAIAIDGAVAGEIALLDRADGGTLILGDALINMEPHGFAFLPAKYCSNPKLMRRSLRKLTEFDFERILFAHGMPVITQARQRLLQLLESA